MTQITLNPEIGGLFELGKFEVFMSSKNANTKSTNSEYEMAKWEINGVNISVYEKKIVIQTKKDPAYHSTVKDICDFPGVIMNTENKTKLASMAPKSHNSMLCPTCYGLSRTIVSGTKGLEITFLHECKHENKMTDPILILNNRILPDLNILISNSLSRLIGMGHFDGYEVIIPKFAMRVAETLGGSKKAGISNEISKLKSLEDEGKIKVMNYGDIDDDESVEKMLSHEDEKLAEISDITNSILVTSDNLFKSNRVLENRPVILIPGDIQEAIKTIHEARVS